MLEKTKAYESNGGCSQRYRWLGLRAHMENSINLKEHPTLTQVRPMSEKFCGVDVHKHLFVATILDGQTQEKQTHLRDGSL